MTEQVNDHKVIYPVQFIGDLSIQLQDKIDFYLQAAGMPDVLKEAIDDLAVASSLLNQYKDPESFKPEGIEGFNRELKEMVARMSWQINQLDTLGRGLNGRHQEELRNAEKISELPMISHWDDVRNAFENLLSEINDDDFNINQTGQIDDGEYYPGKLVFSDDAIDELWAKLPWNTRARWIVNQMGENDDIMPGGCCDDLGLKRGSTFGDGAERFKDVIEGLEYEGEDDDDDVG